jgi:SecD/SecF fusion protein
MTPAWTFTFGLIVLVLFAWYFATDLGRRKRIIGAVLTLLLVALCIGNVYPPSKKIHLGLDLQGGTSFLVRLVAEPNEKGERREISASMLEQAVGVIRKRVDQFGVSEPVITTQGSDRILVQIPGLDAAKTNEARQQLQQVAKLDFRLVHPTSAQLISQIENGSAIIPPGYEIKTSRDVKNGKPVDERLLIKQKPDMVGEHVSGAHAFYDQHGYGVSFKLDSKGADDFGKLTAAHVNERLAVTLDGEVQSAPNIQGAIYGGQPVITGRFSQQEAQNLASVLENPLQTPVSIEETRSASSTLGSDSIKSGIYAGIGGLILVLFFVLIYYRFAGIVAIIGLLVNIVLLFGAMSMFGFVLTLPGIAGIILTIGMAVDANVLIYERLREEMALGKSLRAAIDAAYEKAFTAIFDANATTLITAAILFWKATGSVRGFAITLTIGIIASVFSAMIVTRICFGWALESGLLKRISMLHLISGKNFDFMGKRFLWIGISLAVIAASVAGFVMRGEKNFGIDFKGGDLLMLESKQPVSEAAVREALKPLGIAETVIQKEREPALKKEYITIRSPYDTSEKIESHLQKTMPEADFQEHKRDKVGKLVGGELARGSLIAFGLGMLGILIYVTVRFEFSFALGALVALLHDVIITVGVFAICGRELSLVMVGAILTIAGYSINDTIVVYDRIREGLRSGRKGSIQAIMNASINETLSRTILTSGVTLLSVSALFFFGGPVLNDFAFAILIGIVVGTYSSIFIASPIVLWWTGKKGQGLRSELRAGQPSAARV